MKLCPKLIRKVASLRLSYSNSHTLLLLAVVAWFSGLIYQDEVPSSLSLIMLQPQMPAALLSDGCFSKFSMAERYWYVKLPWYFLANLAVDMETQNLCVNLLKLLTRSKSI